MSKISIENRIFSFKTVLDTIRLRRITRTDICFYLIIQNEQQLNN